MSASTAMLPPAPKAPSLARTGAYAGALETLEPSRSRWPAGRLRRKRWVYALAASDEVLAAAAVVDAGWFAGAFSWAVDRRSGAVILDASAAGLPVLSARVSDHAGPGALVRFSGHGLRVRMERDVRGWLIEVRAGSGTIDAALEVPRASRPFTLVAAVPGGGVRATEKVGALVATGEVRVSGRSLALGGGHGGVDATAGVLARETRWRWAFGTGQAAGEPFAFNLCEGFGVPAGDAGENAAFWRGEPYRLPPVTVLPGTDAWRIASADLSVDLAFVPLAAHREKRNLGVLRTRFTQVAGAFHGTVPGADGAPVAIAQLPGVVEDHWAVW